MSTMRTKISNEVDTRLFDSLKETVPSGGPVYDLVWEKVEFLIHTVVTEQIDQPILNAVRLLIEEEGGIR